MLRHTLSVKQNKSSCLFLEIKENISDICLAFLSQKNFSETKLRKNQRTDYFWTGISSKTRNEAWYTGQRRFHMQNVYVLCGQNVTFLRFTHACINIKKHLLTYVNSNCGAISNDDTS